MQGRGLVNSGPPGMPGRPIAGPSSSGGPLPGPTRMGSHSLPPTAATAPMSAVGQRQTGVTPLGHDALQGQPAKRRKPAIDRHLPLFVPEEHSGTRDSDEVLQSLRENYTSLEALEKKLDWTLSRKKAEYGELLGKSGTHTGQPKGKLGGVKRNLRLSLSHEISAATAQTGRAGPQAAANAAPRDDSVPDGGESKEQTSSGAVEADEQKVAQESPKGESSKPQQWSFKLSGLLQRPQDSEEEPKVHFSSLVTGVVVDILSEDPSNPSAADRIEWHPQPQSEPLDGLTLSRPCPERPEGQDAAASSPLRLRVSLHLSQHPERYKLVEPISRFLDIQEETKAGCLLALWAYIKKNELQDNDNRQVVRCDPFIAMLTNKPPGSPVFFSHLGEFLLRWMQRPDPVVLDYVLDLDKSSDKPEVYDVAISVADPISGSIEKFLSLLSGQSSTITSIVQSDLTLAQACSKAKTTKNKRDVCAAFSTDPIQFIFDYLESQSIDLDNYLNHNGDRAALAALGGPTPNLEDVRRSDFWHNPEWSDEAVRLFSQRQLATKAAGTFQNGSGGHIVPGGGPAVQYARR